MTIFQMILHSLKNWYFWKKEIFFPDVQTSLSLKIRVEARVLFQTLVKKCLFEKKCSMIFRTGILCEDQMAKMSLFAL